MEDIKKTLVEQVKILAERSKNATTEELTILTAQIISIGFILEHQNLDFDDFVKRLQVMMNQCEKL